MSYEQQLIDRVWELPPAPKGWLIDKRLEDGARYYSRARKLSVILSAAIQEDGKPWVHFSLAHAHRIPTWGELRDCKQLFLGNVYAYSVLPPREVYVNIDSRVLHLFHCIDGPQLPEFSGTLSNGARTI